MKALLFITLLFIAEGCAPYFQDLTIAPCNSTEPADTEYSKARELQQTLDELVSKGVPGAALTVYSKEGWWSSSAGFAKIETSMRMEPCHLQFLQSISKTYLAVGILKLREQGKIDLQASIETYLPEKYRQYLQNASNITVYMLLNHTSGIPEYNSQPAYVSKLLSHPDYRFSSEEYLAFIKGKPLDFTAGSRYSYRNTNYLLLALIADAVTGDHAAYLSQHIFAPLELSQTFYRHESGYPDLPNLTNSYWDRHSDGIIENVSRMQLTNVASLIGDDGIIATPTDAVKFLKGLLEGKILSPESLAQMKTWVIKNEKPEYGLGLDYTTFNNQPAYGHSGGGLGAGCQLYYFPEQDVYVFVAINLGTVTESPIQTRGAATLEKIYEIVLR